jgi:hypothetical protein
MSSKETHWILERLREKNIHIYHVAQVASGYLYEVLAKGCSEKMINEVLSGGSIGTETDKAIQKALAYLLGYASFDELMQAARKRKQGGVA